MAASRARYGLSAPQLQLPDLALDVFTEWKSVYVDYSGTLQRAQIDNAE